MTDTAALDQAVRDATRPFQRHNFVFAHTHGIWLLLPSIRNTVARIRERYKELIK